MTARSSISRYGLIWLTFAVALVLVLVPAGLAAKGGNGGSAGNGGGGKPGGDAGGGTVTLVMEEDVNGNGSPNWGDTVSFDVSPDAQLKLTCYQDGEAVYWTETAYYDGYPFWWTQLMKLESGMWAGGAAECAAVLFTSSGRKTATLATLDFHVDA